MTRDVKKMLVILGTVTFLIFGWYFAKKILFTIYMHHYQSPAASIETIIAKRELYHSKLHTIGTLIAVNGADLSFESPGIVTHIYFQSGQEVNKGDLLAELNVDADKATLESSQAHLVLAKLNFTRNEILYKKKILSQAQFDQVQAQLNEAQANHASALARLQQKRVIAPFTGRIGIQQVSLGQFVTPGTVLTSLETLDPMFVNFHISESEIKFIAPQQTITANINGQDYQGKINAINSRIDANSRNVLVQATLSNPNKTLMPGMFANIQIEKSTFQKAIILPETAINFSLHGDSVFIIRKVKNDYQAFQTFVGVGERQSGNVVILKGLEPGDEVVSVGQFKLKNGSRVAINHLENQVEPA